MSGFVVHIIIATTTTAAAAAIRGRRSIVIVIIIGGMTRGHDIEFVFLFRKLSSK
jgi:UDP-N-acetylmuramoylalanine-D-glutamate ligase